VCFYKTKLAVVFNSIQDGLFCKFFSVLKTPWNYLWKIMVFSGCSVGSKVHALLKSQWTKIKGFWELIGHDKMLLYKEVVIGCMNTWIKPLDFEFSYSPHIFSFFIRAIAMHFIKLHYLYQYAWLWVVERRCSW